MRRESTRHFHRVFQNSPSSIRHLADWLMARDSSGQSDRYGAYECPSAPAARPQQPDGPAVTHHCVRSLSTAFSSSTQDLINNALAAAMDVSALDSIDPSKGTLPRTAPCWLDRDTSVWW